MTLIVAIQAKDSIILSADKRIIHMDNQDTDTPSFHSDECKLHLWEKGVVTGSGDFLAIRQANQWLHKTQNIFTLPKKLNDIKRARIIEFGQHEQISTSRIICSVKEKDIPQLYSVGLHHELEKLKPNDVSILLSLESDFSSESVLGLQNLYSSFQDYNQFANNQSWISHYLSLLSNIYKKQSLSCESISRDFHVFFQSSSYSSIVHVINE